MTRKHKLPCALGRFIGVLVTAIALSCSGTNLRADAAPPPADSSVSEAPMIGMFYDLKQTPDHKPSTVDTTSYFKIIDEFLSKHWDESVLNRYYRSSKPIQTTQIFIPSINSSDVTKIFGLGRDIQPGLWIMYYKAQISPPEDGTYRFVGAGDDVIAIAIDGKTVLAAPLRDPKDTLLPITNWHTTEPGGPLVAKESAYYCVNGDWIKLNKNEPVDFEVIFGDCPGSIYSSFILVQEKGKTYQMDADNQPILPILQFAPYDTPQPEAGRQAPKFAKGFPTWKCYQ